MADLTVTAANVIAADDASVKHGQRIGEAFAAGKLVYYDTATKSWKLADSNSATAAAKAATGLSLTGGGVGQFCSILTGGDVNPGATLTAGLDYYLSDTPGGICPRADVGSGENIVSVGFATSTSNLRVKFQNTGVSG